MPGFAQTTLLPAGDYTLTAIAVSKTGGLSFTGLRNADGASVFGDRADGHAPPAHQLTRSIRGRL